MTTRADAIARGTPTYAAGTTAAPPVLSDGGALVGDAVSALAPPVRGTLSPTFPPRAPSRRWSRDEETFIRLQHGCQQ